MRRRPIVEDCVVAIRSPEVVGVRWRAVVDGRTLPERFLSRASAEAGAEAERERLASEPTARGHVAGLSLRNTDERSS